MKTAYQHIKTVLKKFTKSAIKNIDRLEYDLLDSEQTKKLTDDEIEKLKKRARAALNKSEERKLKQQEKKNAKLTDEEREKNPFWRMMKGLKPEKKENETE